MRPGGVHEPDVVPEADLAQHGVQVTILTPDVIITPGVQLTLPGAGARLPGAEPRDHAGPRPPVQPGGRPHHHGDHHPGLRAEDVTGDQSAHQGGQEESLGRSQTS